MLDASIPLQAKSSVQLLNPMDIAQQAMTMKKLAQQNAAYDQEQAQANSMRDILRKNVVTDVNGNSTLNKQAAISDLYKVSPEKAMAYQQQFQKQDLERLKNEADIKNNLAWQISDEASYQQARKQAIEMGLPNAEKMPPQYPGDSFIRQMQMSTLSAKEQLDQQWKKMDFDKDVTFKQGDLDIKKDAQKLDWAKLANEKDKTNIDRMKAKNESKNIPQNVYAAATYGKRVEDANNQMNELMKDGYDPTSYSQSLINKVTPEALKGDKPKLMDQAQRNFINAVLRRESGSAIASTEFDSARMQYFPQVGDSKEVLEQKARNRDVALSGLKSEGGKAWDQVENNLTTKTQDKNVRVVNGQTYRKVEGGWLPAQK